MKAFREEKILPMLKDLKEQRSALNDYIDDGEEASVVERIRAGNAAIFPAAGEFASAVNTNVRKMRDQLKVLIDQFEELDRRLEQAHIRFEDAEDDAVITARDLAELIDPGNAASVRAGSGDSGSDDGDSDGDDGESDGDDEK
ncbi:MAG TPA: hypothetical protein K8V84_18145 [Nocardiopsis listeri]|uniref:hypothetical protein n=1 Tax=Nocardiopsis listeri TaxID=53440 RepID=UPI001D1A7B53|nr:hypothetical protein [Nocardiopsis listeri]HJE60408.1 hypothetical protein [Nocardiopsis listeri]